MAVNAGRTLPIVQPRDRIYIMVTASHRVNTFLNDANGAEWEPSYDMVVRKFFTTIT